MRFKFYKEITSQTRKLLYELKNFSPVNFANNTPIKTTQYQLALLRKIYILLKSAKLHEFPFRVFL